MLFLLRQIRRKLLMKNKIATYLLYSIGEIFLVVVGILIAVQIDDVYKEKERRKDELNSYRLIIADLKKDSATFSRYHRAYTNYLDLYYEVNRIHAGTPTKQSQPYFDYLVSNIQFNPVTQENHRNTIDRMTDQEVREQLNVYFAGLGNVEITVEEFNEYIRDIARPFFLDKFDVFDNRVVFDEQDRTFPPFKRASTFDIEKMHRLIKNENIMPIVSGLRMSMGAYLAFLELSIKQNHELIQTLHSKL